MRAWIFTLCLCVPLAASPGIPLFSASALSGAHSGISPRSYREAATQVSLPFRTHPDDELTRSAFALLYNMDYDAAIAQFRQELQTHPDDPFAVNHLLAAVLGKELNREGAFDAALYTGNRFLQLKPEPIDPQVKTEIVQLAEKSQALATAELTKNPEDTSALVARAAARGYEALFDAVVEKHWVGALRQSLGSYHDDEQVLKLDPNNPDAKFVVGSMLYVVGSLSWYERMIAFVVTLHGNKQKGRELLRAAAASDGESTMDARMFLSLFLARDKIYDEPIALMHRSYSEFPHNFLYGVSEAELLAAAGKRDDAIAAYRELIAMGQRNAFPNARPERAALLLGELFRKGRDFKEAADAFDEAAKFPHPDNAIVAHCDLEAGEMYDALGDRSTAVARYNEVLRLAPASDDARSAERYLKRSFHPSE